LLGKAEQKKEVSKGFALWIPLRQSRGRKWGFKGLSFLGACFGKAEQKKEVSKGFALWIPLRQSREKCEG
jgi:hypothetical protein